MVNDLSSAELKIGVDIAAYLQPWLNLFVSQALKIFLVTYLKTILDLYLPHRPPTTIYNHSEILLNLCNWEQECEILWEWEEEEATGKKDEFSVWYKN